MANQEAHIALVLFGGSGERFGAPMPKQFVVIDDKPLLLETLERIAACSCVDEIYAVSRQEDIQRIQELARGIAKLKGVIPGGTTRQDSSRNGVDYLVKAGYLENDLVAICDGDRPCVEEELFTKNYEAAKECGAAVTVAPCRDSVLLSKDQEFVSEYLNRDEVCLVSTPQTFRLGVIAKGHHRASALMTDDASLVEEPVRLVKWDHINVKITVKEDIEAFKQWKKQRN